MTEIIKLETPELNLIEASKAQQIRSAFEPMVAMLEEFEDQYNGIISESKNGITQELTTKAKRIRIDIGKVRIETGKRKDQQKESLKREDRAIMAVHNILVWAVTDKENHLKDIENHFEIQEAKRLNDLQNERVEQLTPYVEDAHDRNLSGMDDDVWNAYLSTKKNEHEDRIEAEKKAEADRIKREKAEAVERERIRKENEQLRKAAEERERIAKIEAEQRAKAERERIAKEDAERKVREEKDRKEREAREAAIRESERVLLLERKAAAEKLKKEMDNARRLADELREKEAAERRAKEEALAKAESELAKGDAEKVKDLINDLIMLKTKYQFKSAKNKKIYAGVYILIDKIINYIHQ